MKRQTKHGDWFGLVLVIFCCTLTDTEAYYRVGWSLNTDNSKPLLVVGQMIWPRKKDSIHVLVLGEGGVPGVNVSLQSGFQNYSLQECYFTWGNYIFKYMCILIINTDLACSAYLIQNA
jgi:hypothetical protein